MDGVPAQYMQLYPRDDVLEVVLSGRAGVEAAVTKLQGAKQQPLLCAQEAVFCANLTASITGISLEKPLNSGLR